MGGEGRDGLYGHAILVDIDRQTDFLQNSVILVPAFGVLKYITEQKQQNT